MSEQKDYLNCRKDVVRGLLEALNAALTDKFPNSRANPDDLEQMLAALRLLEPSAPELDAIGGMMHVARGDWIAATEVFRELVAQGRCLPHSQALLIYCMSENNDADWAIEANQVIQNETYPDALKLVRVIKASHDLKRAVSAFQATGQFDMPDSLKELAIERRQQQTQEAAAAQPVPSAIDPALMMGGQYMRL